MSIEIAVCRNADEILPAFRPIFHYFGTSPRPEHRERFIPFIEPSRAFAATEAGEVIGGFGSFPFQMTVPGGAVRTSGLTVVGVLPTHRRRGVLRRMMRAHLDDARRRAEPVAALWASEDVIYGQFGYGQASFSGDIDLPRSAAAFAMPFERRGTPRMLSEQDAVAPMAAVYERVRPRVPGMLTRSDDWWRHRRAADPEFLRRGGGELNRVVLFHDGRPSGYALYRVQTRFDSGSSGTYLDVIEALGEGLEATREIWRFLLDIDWTAQVKAALLPLDHPLFFLLARPREMRFRVHDGLWVRLIDLPAALAARRLGEGESVVFEVADAFCDWNAGRWRVGPGGAERTSDDADLECDITALGSVYLGGFTFRQLARAGRVTERREGAVARADALFPSEGAPWCPEVF